jgi:hypothetical protein
MPHLPRGQAITKAQTGRLWNPKRARLVVHFPLVEIAPESWRNCWISSFEDAAKLTILKQAWRASSSRSHADADPVPALTGMPFRERLAKAYAKLPSDHVFRLVQLPDLRILLQFALTNHCCELCAPCAALST